MSSDCSLPEGQPLLPSIRYTARDGTLAFYRGVRARVQPAHRVLDLGAGRGGWHFQDLPYFKRHIRTLRGVVREYIGADIDAAVLDNPTTDRNVLIRDGLLPLADASIDVIVCDNVLEHVVDPVVFVGEVDRVLKPGGYFCARTVHAAHYVAIAARLVPHGRHRRWLRRLQPERDSADVFPTVYKFNTRRRIRAAFAGWEDTSYIFRSEPSYFFGSQMLFAVLSALHRVVPAPLVGSIIVFLRKPSSP